MGASALVTCLHWIWLYWIFGKLQGSFCHLFHSSALRSHKSSLDLGQLARALGHLTATVWPIGHRRTMLEPGSGLRFFELLWLSHWRWKRAGIHWVEIAYVKTCPDKMWQKYAQSKMVCSCVHSSLYDNYIQLFSHIFAMFRYAHVHWSCKAMQGWVMDIVSWFGIYRCFFQQVLAISSPRRSGSIDSDASKFLRIRIGFRWWFKYMQARHYSYV